MKTKSIWLVTLFIMSVVGCKYDDGALWDKVNSLDERVASIEDKLKTMNNDISAISTIVNALQNKVYVESVEYSNDGYVIEFTDGTKATIKNGKDGVDGTDGADGKDGVNGKDGKDAPVIGVDVFEGKYYWTQTLEGTKSWLTDADGNKIPVTGADAVTPQLKIDSDGYWLVSYDAGTTFVQMLDEVGNPVKAVGKDGNDGTDGINGDSFFQSVKVEGNQLILVLKDGKELSIPISTGTEELPAYIALNQSLGEQVDYAILGLDGSGYFYEFQDENPSLPKRLSIYDGIESKVNLVINFDDEGMPKNILSESFTIVLGKYEENRFNAVVITKEGESAIYENVEAELFWNEYKNGLLEEGGTKALSHSPIKWVNAGVGAIGCALSIASTVVTAPTGIGAVIGWGLTAINCTGAIMSIADAAGWIEIPQGSAIANTTIGHYANLASCIGAGTGNWVAVSSCLTGIVNNVTAIGDLIYDLAKDDITLGEGSLISGNGEVKITLTWDNYGDIDLHCVDPSGFHIYFDDKLSPTGGFLDYDNVDAYGPENIYFNPAPEGSYHVFLHYYEAHHGVNSVKYKVAIFVNGLGRTYEGTIAGEDSVVDISTFMIGTITNNTKSLTRTGAIDWKNLPKKR